MREPQASPDAQRLAARILDPCTRITLVTCGTIRDEAWRIGPRQVDGHILHAVLSGGHCGWAGTDQVRTRHGDLLWLPPAVRHVLAIDRRAGRPRILRLRCRFDPDPGLGSHAIVCRLPLAGMVLDQMVGGGAAPAVLRAGLALIAAGLGGAASPANLASRRLDRLQRLLAQEPERAWSPTLAARELGCTGLAANRSIHAATGRSLRRWLLETRLRAAADELADGAAVAEAARRHGWRDAFLFSRQFRAMFGMPPSRWPARP